jgi:hypothetical protein
MLRLHVSEGSPQQQLLVAAGHIDGDYYEIGRETIE